MANTTLLPTEEITKFSKLFKPDHIAVKAEKYQTVE